MKRYQWLFWPANLFLILSAVSMTALLAMGNSWGLAYLPSLVGWGTLVAILFHEKGGEE